MQILKHLQDYENIFRAWADLMQAMQDGNATGAVAAGSAVAHLKDVVITVKVVEATIGSRFC